MTAAWRPKDERNPRKTIVPLRLGNIFFLPIVILLVVS